MIRMWAQCSELSIINFRHFGAPPLSLNLPSRVALLHLEATLGWAECSPSPFLHRTTRNVSAPSQLLLPAVATSCTEELHFVRRWQGLRKVFLPELCLSLFRKLSSMTLRVALPLGAYRLV